MAQVNARDWIFEVSEDDGTTWTPILGLNSFELNPAENEESADTTTFASKGTHESQAMQRGATLNVTGRLLHDGSGVQDPGQTAVETLAGETGETSLGLLRFRHESQTDWTEWTAWASLGTKSGANNDKTSWGATFTRSGSASTTAVSTG